jgi:hypothetical protein
MPKRTLTLRLPGDLTDQIKENAVQKSITVTEFITRLIKKGLEDDISQEIGFSKQIKELEFSLRQSEDDKHVIKDKLESVEHDVDGLRTENASIKVEVNLLREVVLAGVAKK